MTCHIPFPTSKPHLHNTDKNPTRKQLTGPLLSHGCKRKSTHLVLAGYHNKFYFIFCKKKFTVTIFRPGKALRAGAKVDTPPNTGTYPGGPVRLQQQQQQQLFFFIVQDKLTLSCFCCSSSSSPRCSPFAVRHMSCSSLSSHRFSHLYSCFLLLLSIFHLPLPFLLKRLSLSSILVPIGGRLLLLLHPLSLSLSLSLSRGLALSSLQACYLLPHLSRFRFFFFFFGVF